MAGLDLAREVTPTAMSEHGDGDGPRIAVIDTGIKGSIVRNLVARGARVELHPCTATAAELTANDPDAIFLANGPGDPAALGYVVQTVRELVGTRPVWGICLGHQLLCQAVGLETYKLAFGHRGANHPVKDLRTGKIEITSQNHGFAVSAPDGGGRVEADEPVRWETDFGAAALTPRQPLRPHGRGPRAAGGRERHRPVPPRGGAGTQRRPVPVRPLPGGRPCRVGTTCTRSSSSARGRSSSARRPSSTIPACRRARSSRMRATRSSWSTRTRRRS